jgi:hypothetical protein
VRLSRGTLGMTSLVLVSSGITVADREGSQVGQMVLARGPRSAELRAPDDLYLLYIRENVTNIERALPRLT